MHSIARFSDKANYTATQPDDNNLISLTLIRLTLIRLTLISLTLISLTLIRLTMIRLTLISLTVQPNLIVIINLFSYGKPPHYNSCDGTHEPLS